MTDMTTETTTATGSGQDTTAEEKINQLRKLFANAPEVGWTAPEKVLSRLASDAPQKPRPPAARSMRVKDTGPRRCAPTSEAMISSCCRVVPRGPGTCQAVL
jgi:hypothetical protein